MKLENSLFSPPNPCLTPPLGGISSEFLDETYNAKTRGMGLPYGENCMILTSTVFDWSTRVTDGRTDGWAIAYTRYSIYAVARKNVSYTLILVSSQLCEQLKGTTARWPALWDAVIPHNTALIISGWRLYTLYHADEKWTPKINCYNSTKLVSFAWNFKHANFKIYQRELTLF